MWTRHCAAHAHAGDMCVRPCVFCLFFFFFNDTATTEIYTLSLHDALPIYFQSHGQVILLSPFVIFQIALAISIMLIAAALFRFTKLGLQLRASALAPEVARLLGVRVSRMLTIGWMLSAGVGAVAAVIIASGSFGLYPTNMNGIFVAGFIAAVVGGLDSPLGPITGGLLIGLAEQFILSYWSAHLAPLGSIIILLVALMIRPQGIFSKSVGRRV